MRISRFLIPTFTVAVSMSGMGSAQNGQFPSYITSSTALSIFPATTPMPDSQIFTYPNTALADDVDDDENGVPDEEDILWTNEFLAGEPVDPSMDFYTRDLIEGDAVNTTSHAAALNARSTAIQNDTLWNEFVTALAKNRLQYAFSVAHYRARLRQAGELPSGSPDEEDALWAQDFFNGAEVSEDMIFNSTDLDEPDEDPTNDILLLGYADWNTSSTDAADLSTEDSASVTQDSQSTELDKRHHHRHHRHHHRYKHPARNSLQVLRRTLRAIRRARHRARVRQNLRAHRRAVRRARREKARAHRIKSKIKHHLNHVIHNHPPHPQKHKKGKAENHPKHKPKSHHCRVPPGYLCNGQIDCHWWCVRGILNCGQFVANC